MISAENAREIQKQAQEERDAYIKSVVEDEVEEVCEVIESAARDRRNRCCFDAAYTRHPSLVAEYLTRELGYAASYSNKTISVSW